MHAHDLPSELDVPVAIKDHDFLAVSVRISHDPAFRFTYSTQESSPAAATAKPKEKTAEQSATTVRTAKQTATGISINRMPRQNRFAQPLTSTPTACSFPHSPA